MIDPADYAAQMMVRRHEMAPLFVVAPSARCGTTLVQRLLNSSRQIVVYGEDHMMFNAMPPLVTGILAHRDGPTAKDVAQQRRQFLAGDTNDWTGTLLPDPKDHAEFIIRQAVELFAFYESDARRLGFARWGVKYPLRSWRPAEVIGRLLPSARFLVLYRHVLDALASAKGRGWIQNEAAAREFAGRWSDNLVGLIGWPNERKRALRYEDLTGGPELSELAAFAGVERIDPAVMGQRVNTFKASGPGNDPSGYVAPAELSDAERALALEISEPGLRAGGYL